MWKAIVALSACVGAHIAKGQDIAADEALFHEQINRYVKAHPEEAGRVQAELAPMFRYIQGEWISEWSRKARSPWDNPTETIMLTFTGMNVKYAEMRGSEELRSARGRLEVESTGVALRLSPDPANSNVQGSSDHSPFKIPTFVLGSAEAMRQPSANAYLSCRFDGETWKTFETVDGFWTGVELRKQLAEDAPAQTPFSALYDTLPDQREELPAASGGVRFILMVCGAIALTFLFRGAWWRVARNSV